MGKRSIVFACGCERSVNIKREGAEEWLKTQICFVCEGEKAVNSFNEKLPEMTGTDKQKKWAKTIRYEYHQKYGASAKGELLNRTYAGDWICWKLNGQFEQKPRKVETWGDV